MVLRRFETRSTLFHFFDFFTPPCGFRKSGDVASLTYDPQAHNCVLVLASGKNVTVQLKDTSFMQYSKCIYAHLFGTEVGVESIHGYKNFAFHMSVISKPTETPEIVPPSAKGLFVRLPLV